MSCRPSTPAWQGTWLWKELEQRVAQNRVHATEFVPTLTLWMRKLETVLRNGGTVPYRSKRADHLMSLWAMISAATGRPLADLRLISTNGSGEVLLSPSEVVAPTVLELRPSLLPRVTDPAFLLHEVNELA